MYKLFFTILLIATQAFPQTGYMIPDAGGPGMSVYIEIIAQPDQKGYFGDDGFYINNDSESNRVLASGATSNFLEISPFVVSWEGRMISAYVFVDDNANPNSDDYTQLRPEFVNNISVEIDGNELVNYQFHIIRPSQVGATPATGSLLGRVPGQNNGVGFVSPRNTIVLDSLTLNDEVYDINIDDPDPSTPGNQAYLPLIILSEGPIRGLGPNSAINASASDKNGGPGGGGGAGKIGDAVNVFGIVTGASGSDGGAGFTGGGAGGRNIAGGSSTRRDGGIGSGSDFLTDNNFEGSIYRSGGTSLNGVIGGRLLVNSSGTNFNPESSGGGTGHPFGRSSEGYNNNNDIGRSDGQYGGGTGNFGGRKGGDGGFATDGVGDPNFYSGANAGKRHGNDYGVPIAGGSGGGSGNPNNVGEEGGDGGGGGGAIRLFASAIENVRVRADGADGLDTDEDGGSGSGGYVELSSKTSVNNVQFSASPAESAGKGRFRFDVFRGSPDLIAGEDNPVRFQGMATDSASFVPSSHTITGVKGLGPSLEYYYKPKNGNWSLLSDVDPAATRFEIPVEFTTAATKWYGASFLKVNDNPVYINDYEQEPDYILSQAAANYFQLISPEIECEDDITINRFSCETSPTTYQFEIENIGSVDLNIDLANLSWNEVNAQAANGTPSVVNPLPNEEITISPNSSSFLEIEFDIDPIATGNLQYRLILPNNDADENPKIIDFEIVLVDEYFRIVNNETGDEVNRDAVDVCLGDDPYYDKNFLLENVSPADLDLSEIRTDAPDFIIETLNDEFPYEFNIRLPNTGQDPGIYTSMIYFYIEECDDPVDSLEIVVNIKISELTMTPSVNFEYDFGTVKVGESRTEFITFRNTGTTPVDILSVINVDPPFRIVSYNINGNNFPPPRVLQLGEQIIIEVEFAPTAPGDFETVDSKITINSNSPNLNCIPEYPFKFTGVGATSDLEFGTQLNWGTHEYCYFPASRTFTIKNNDSPDHNISDFEIVGQDADLFEIQDFIPNNRLIRANDSLLVVISLDPSIRNITSGELEAAIEFQTDDPDLPDFQLNLFAELIDMEYEITPTEINLGQIPWGIPVNFDLDATNSSTLNGLEYSRTDANFANIDPGVLINPNETTNLEWEFTPLQGVQNESMTFWMRSDFEGCEYPMEVDIIYEGVDQDLNFDPEIIDFGTLVNCIDLEELEINISREGIGDVIINSIELVNSTTQAISKFNDPPDITINSNTYTVTIFYEIDIAEFGQHTAELLIEYTANGESRQFTIPISAGKTRLLEANPIEIDLGQIPVLTNLTENLILEKLIDEAYTYLPDQPVEDGDPANQIGQTLTENIYPDPDDIEIDFQANELGPFSTTLTYNYSFDNYSDCEESVSVVIFGEVVSEMELDIFTIDQEIDPTLDKVNIPIYGKLKGDNNYTFDIDTLKVAVDRSVFYPNSVETGNINNLEYAGDNLIISIERDDVVISPNDSLLALISGTPLLGDKKTSLASPIRLQINPQELLSSATYTPGNLTLIVCEEGGDRLLQALTPIDLTISTSNSEIQINTNVIEAGKHSIEVSNINGEVVFSENWFRGIGETTEYDFRVGKSSLSTGTYFVTLKTPNRTKVKLVQVIR